MKILPIFPDNWFYGLIRELAIRGVEIVADRPDAIIVGSISQLARAEEAAMANPGVPVFSYNWDLYEWSRRGKCYDYDAWGRLMRLSREVWHPSECTMRRAKDWYGLTNGQVIRTFVPVAHLEGAEPSDNGYALMALRESPDPGRKWFFDACAELGIPHRSTDLRLPGETFADVLAGATLLVNPLREASTGGLFLIEGLSLGKAALVSASPWNAGREYLGPFNRSPKIDTYERFRDELRDMWEEKPVHDRLEASAFIADDFSVSRMADEVMDRLGVKI